MYDIYWDANRKVAVRTTSKRYGTALKEKYGFIYIATAHGKAISITRWIDDVDYCYTLKEYEIEVEKDNNTRGKR